LGGVKLLSSGDIANVIPAKRAVSSREAESREYEGRVLNPPLLGFRFHRGQNGSRPLLPLCQVNQITKSSICIRIHPAAHTCTEVILYFAFSPLP
jgi:hypothetical protein